MNHPPRWLPWPLRTTLRVPFLPAAAAFRWERNSKNRNANGLRVHVNEPQAVETNPKRFATAFLVAFLIWDG